MDIDSVLLGAAFMFGKHSGTCTLTLDGADMFSRVLDLPVRAGIGNAPTSGKAGRAGPTCWV